MKTILLTLTIICFTCSLHAQTLEPSPLIFGYGTGDTTAFRVRPTIHFTLGANWGSSRNFAETYRLNASHGGWNASWTMRPNDYTDSMRLILFTEPISTTGQGGGLFYAQSMHFDPTVTVDETDGFTARAGDTTGGVFGWHERDTTLTSDTTDADFDRMQTRLVNYTGTPTL